MHQFYKRHRLIINRFVSMNIRNQKVLSYNHVWFISAFQMAPKGNKKHHNDTMIVHEPKYIKSLGLNYVEFKGEIPYTHLKRSI